MDSYYFTPAQRFYGAEMTAELVASNNGIIKATTTASKSKFKTEYIFYGILALGVIATCAALFVEVKKTSLSEDKLNV